MVARSAPTIPRWCFTVRRERFLATSSVIPFLCIRRKTCVQAILRGFFRCMNNDAFLEDAKRKTCAGRNEPSAPVGKVMGLGSYFTVPTNEKFALTGVDFVPRERIEFDLLYSEKIHQTSHGWILKAPRTICETPKATKSQPETLVAYSVIQNALGHPT